MSTKLPDTSTELKAVFRRFVIVVIFSIALGYFEAAVVVYLRAIFYPDGFVFPLAVFGIDSWGKELLITEVGREAASLVLIFTAAWLFGRDSQQRFAFFAIIFAVWDIFYYVWLKVLIDWPGSLMDWDILFLIPAIWASPVLAPVLVSVILLIFAVIVLYRSSLGASIKPNLIEWLGFVISGMIIVTSFCIAGRGISGPDFESFFSWPLFAAGNLAAIILFFRCLVRSGAD